jgi:hypothetical protein
MMYYYDIMNIITNNITNNHKSLSISICKSEIKKLNNHQKSSNLNKNVEREIF